jgi:hypothetical protein
MPFKPHLATRRITFEAQLPPEADFTEQPAVITYVWRPGGLVEVIRVACGGKVKDVTGRGLDAVEELCLGHWAFHERRA